MIRSKRGFTLMELLLVVAILAIVAAAAAPSFFGGATDAMNEARKSAFMSNYNSLLSAGNIYLANQQAKGAAAAVSDSELYTALKDNYVPQSTFTAKGKKGATKYFAMDIVAAGDKENNPTYKVEIYLGDTAGTKKSGATAITDPEAAWASF